MSPPRVAIRAGANGALPKRSETRIFYSSDWTGPSQIFAVDSRLMSRARGEGPLATLSEREQSILALVAEGRSDDAITQHLGVTADVLEVELRDVFAKLGLSGTRDDLRRVASVLDYLRSTV